MSVESRWALERAKENVEKHFPLVGLTSEFNRTVEMMERIYPEDVFEGLTVVRKTRAGGEIRK